MWINPKLESINQYKGFRSDNYVADESIKTPIGNRRKF